MTKRRATVTVLCIAFASIALAAPRAEAFVDGGKDWRQLYETTGLTWAQVASVCPRDGATACTGTIAGKDLTGWVWATDTQVLDLMDGYEPSLSTTNPSVSGPAYFLPAISFHNVMRWTTSFSSNYHTSAWTGGWTASTGADGVPIGGGVGYAHPVFNGQLGVGPVPDAASSARGVFLWRPAGFDYTAPVIAPVVTGTVGTNGWYVSNVSVAWTVSDPESAITSTEGCGPTTVVADTAGSTFTCSATSAGLGGPSTSSTSLKRDATGPTVVCDVAVFERGQFPANVSATVSDALSGPPSASIKRLVSTSTVGSFTTPVVANDRAGNRTTRSCGYKVVAATCRGLAATVVGTTGNDVLTGTPGRDIISALGGTDTVDGLAGNDVICGGDGPDVVRGGGGNDTIDGGASDDDLLGGAGNDTIDGAAGANDSVRGDAGTDTCTSGERRMSSCEVIV